MAKPVVINIVGDPSRFNRSVDEAGNKLSGFGARAEQEGRKAGEGFDRAAEGADTAEGRAQGLASTLTGTKDTMAGVGMVARGDLFNGFVMLGQGAADLAEGLNYTVIPTAKAAARAFTTSALSTARDTVAKVTNRAASIASAVATRAMTIAQWALNVALRANPIGIVITAITLLVAAFIIAYRRSDTFRAIVQRAWAQLKAGVAVIVDVLSWLGRLGAAFFNFGKNAILSFINGIKSMAGAVLNAIKSIIPAPIAKLLPFGEVGTGPASRLPGGLSGLAGGPTPPGAGAGRTGPQSINVYARTDADPAEIGREVAWALRTAGV